jgi:hypothetical protein
MLTLPPSDRGNVVAGVEDLDRPVDWMSPAVIRRSPD